jgi:polysaccharide biosynthesis/export protein
VANKMHDSALPSHFRRWILGRKRTTRIAGSAGSRENLTAFPPPYRMRLLNLLTSGNQSVLKLTMDRTMPNNSSSDVVLNRPSKRTMASRLFAALALGACGLTLLIGASGCQTNRNSEVSKSEMDSISKATNAEQGGPTTNSDLLVLHEGDVLSVSFAGAPDLNTIATIRRDGRITLKSLGEFKAAGLTPPEMEKELIKLYGPQLQTKEVTVSVQSSAFPVYVTGAVLRPGKVLSDRPINALEAVMEAGGFDYSKANLKSVRVLRNSNGQTEHFTLNLKEVLRGNKSEQFNLKPGDILYVPEKFSMF